MILSVSRRTDIPAFYAEWFCRRLEAGELQVRNPVNPHQISRLVLNPETVDGLVFWTRNAEPLLSRLPRLEPYPYYFLYTLTPYGEDLEPGLPSLPRRIEVFRNLSRLIGPDRVIWRYDPIILSGDFTADWHLRQFTGLLEALIGFTRRCIVSFLDVYPAVKRNLPWFTDPPPELKRDLVARLALLTARAGVTLSTCAEGIDCPGVTPGGCVDTALLESIGGRPLRRRRDRGQRKSCLCHESRDVGTYGTCRFGCLYCYADRGRRIPSCQDPDSPLLGD
jgi:hypothetical protein